MTGMQMAMMAGSEAAKVTLTAYAPTDLNFTPNSAVAVFQLNSDRTVTSTQELPPNWLNSVGNVANYECRATQISGGLISGTFGAWLPLSTSRTWSVTKGGGGAGTTVADMTVEIRDAATLTVLASATVSFYTEVI